MATTRVGKPDALLKEEKKKRSPQAGILQKYAERNRSGKFGEFLDQAYGADITEATSPISYGTERTKQERASNFSRETKQTRTDVNDTGIVPKNIDCHTSDDEELADKIIAAATNAAGSLPRENSGTYNSTISDEENKNNEKSVNPDQHNTKDKEESFGDMRRDGLYKDSSVGLYDDIFRSSNSSRVDVGNVNEEVWEQMTDFSARWAEEEDDQQNGPKAKNKKIHGKKAKVFLEKVVNKGKKRGGRHESDKYKFGDFTVGIASMAEKHMINRSKC